MTPGCKISMIIEENNQNKQGGQKLKTVDYCLQYGNENILNKKLNTTAKLKNLRTDFQTGTQWEKKWTRFEVIYSF